jgi:putative membrane protein
MFIDYNTLLLINMMAGYFLLAHYVFAGLDGPDQTRWAPGFLMVGLVAVFFGALMTLTWPLPGPYNSAFGEMSVLLGVIFLVAGLALAKGWSLTSVACYAFFAGCAAVLLGVRIIALNLTAAPRLSGAGFIISGLGGVFAAPTLAYLRGNRPFRTIAAIVLVVAALIWAVIGYGGYWGHMASFGEWVPLPMRAPGH